MMRGAIQDFVLTIGYRFYKLRITANVGLHISRTILYDMIFSS